MNDGPSDAGAPAAASARTALIWDLPTRLFHWLLAVLIGLSWWSAEEHLYDLHLWLGLAVLTLLIFRILWGFAGSSTARFSSFIRGPGAVLGYLRGSWRGIGHNPLGALSVVALLLLVAAVTGLGLFSSDEDGLLLGPLSGLVTTGASEQLTELHEELFDILLVLIGVHVAAIAFYWIRGKNLLGPMISGRGTVEPGAEPMRPAKWWIAILCLVVALAITRWIIAGAPPFGT